MARLSAKKRTLIIALVTETGKTVSQILEEHGVARSTYYGSWLKDSDFIEAHLEERRIFESELRHIPYTSRRRRLEKRQEMIDRTPLFYVDDVLGIENIPVDKDGNPVPLTDPTFHEIRECRLLKLRSNMPAISSALNDMEREVEGTRFSIGEPGAVDQLDLIERRKRAYAELEAFEAELEESQKERGADAGDDGLFDQPLPLRRPEAGSVSDAAAKRLADARQDQSRCMNFSAKDEPLTFNEDSTDV